MNWDLVTAVILALCLHTAVLHVGSTLYTDARQFGHQQQAMVIEMIPPAAPEAAAETPTEVIEPVESISLDTTPRTIAPPPQPITEVQWIDDSQPAAMIDHQPISAVEPQPVMENTDQVASVKEPARPQESLLAEVTPAPATSTAEQETLAAHPIAQPEIVAANSGNHDAIATYAPDPQYPLEARRRGYEGVVILNIEVLTTGQPGKVSIEQSSGRRILDRAALAAVKKWQFDPATRNNQPITQTVTKPIHFVIER